jgi:hypothetical protein
MLSLKRKCKEKKDVICGEKTPGYSIMTIHRLMHRYWFVTFWSA